MKVYWIKTKEMTDPYSEGYIGVTANSLDDRLNGHLKSNSKCSIIKKALDKYETEMVELHDVPQKEALMLEEHYRPSEKIGWNICKGGGYPPRNSEETKKKISEAIKKIGTVPYDKNKTHSPEAIAKANAKRIGRKRYHNPATGEQRMMNPNNVPEGWVLGSYING